MLLIVCRLKVFITYIKIVMNAAQVRTKLGNAIRAKRVPQRLSQEALADKCGLHRTYVGSVERGERNVSIDNIARIAKALGISVAELIRTADL